MSNAAARRLKKELRELQRKPVEGFSVGLRNGNLFEWDVIIVPPTESLFEGGFFRAELSFPSNYPSQPPKMKFKSDIWHPNIYKDGKVCISILHPPGKDEFGYEDAHERWLPIYTVETILVNVITMLSAPNDESPANVDAAKEWRNARMQFQSRVKQCVEKSMNLMMA
mmetsp:Transcript_6815/g.9942  ORF Transcript_6815/g.9942 Transcript_6815/m.9942 type:complete len:168 (-) Transcript_6815:774-1277(-)|eukprot:CAMPEP_0117425400 /NCGR_PEP_ID=MMETSP0758-20121206/5662_1 /TAXON_ID=63605 /ORGANISM="Percolomonas cosmopolitus, Strain AE-1 (ATCC 50343)" /LENGTH=167 /DNA_ID=CAMNT_0005209827 /DNA_START=47 /DNA_END=550 /DNA_ORIENTATION=+